MRGVEAELWQNAAFVHAMQERGTGLDLAENDQKNIVLTVVSEDELDRIELQIGLY